MNNSKNDSTHVNFSSRNLWTGFLLGLGIVAFIDETLFHQLLHWHHFYDKSTTGVGLVSDGLFHAFSWFATIISLFMYADLRRKNGLLTSRLIGGLLFGAGLFQLYDGTIQHKIQRLHQIRYHVNTLPYDLTWNIIATLMVVIGVILLIRTRNIHQGREQIG